MTRGIHYQDEFSLPIRINEDTLEKIFFKFRRKLAFYCTEFTIDEATAKDRISEVFLNVWRNRNHLQFPNERALSTFLYTATRNACIDYLRKRQSEKIEWHGSAHDFMNMGEESVDEWSKSQITLTEALDTITRALSALPPKQRMVIELALAGKKGAEIAETLHISQSAVKVNKFKAIKTLRKKFAENSFVMFLLLLL